MYSKSEVLMLCPKLLEEPQSGGWCLPRADLTARDIQARAGPRGTGSSCVSTRSFRRRGSPVLALTQLAKPLPLESVRDLSRKGKGPSFQVGARSRTLLGTVQVSTCLSLRDAAESLPGRQDMLPVRTPGSCIGELWV